MRNSVSAASSERWNPASGRVGLTHAVENAPRGRVPPNATASLRWLKFIFSLPSRALSALIWIYQKTISPALVVAAPNCGCRFAPTCSHYAREALHEHGLLVGLALTVRRLVKCGPWHPGGLDPVPQKSRPICTAVHRGI